MVHHTILMSPEFLIFRNWIRYAMCTWSSHRVSGNNQQGNWEAFVGCTEDIEKVLATVDFVKNCPRARLWGGIQRVQRRCRGLREKYSGVLHGNSRKFARVENNFSLLARRSPTRKLPKICKSRNQLSFVGKAESYTETPENLQE